MELKDKKKRKKRIARAVICGSVLLLALYFKLQFGSPSFYDYEGKVWKSRDGKIMLEADVKGEVKLGLEGIPRGDTLGIRGVPGRMRSFSISYYGGYNRVWDISNYIIGKTMFLYVRKDYVANYGGQWFVLRLENRT
ncbi:MAG: hypothetical protein E7280_03970 [Lachnospiraceae bacterium]|nr:hypothetical protein [Lachnospiraceae bacterium]